jgi:hypothetical protein
MVFNKDFIFVDGNKNNKENWFYSKYYYSGNNFRFWTFKLALNILSQRNNFLRIIETGCQRQKDDLGSGMSTSIFAEFLTKTLWGGYLHVVDNNQKHLNNALECVEEFRNVADTFIYFHHMDSVKFLQEYDRKCDLLYLDSYDYPYGKILNKYGGRQDVEKAINILSTKTHKEIFDEFEPIIRPCQEHCFNEFKAIENRLDEETILLIDDNGFPGGGKPGLLKPYLIDQGWICLLDFQQTLWVRSI